MTIFFRLLATAINDKAAFLAEEVAALNITGATDNTYISDPKEFGCIPRTPFSYWIGERVRSIFKNFYQFEGSGRTIRVGLQTSDDFRFVRTWWEIPPTAIATGYNDSSQNSFRSQTASTRFWCSFAKGGSYSPYYADLFLVINWCHNGEELKAWTETLYGGTHWSKSLRNIDYYFLPGLTYPRRSHKLSASALPCGTITSVRGTGIYAPKERLSILLGLISSSTFDYLVKVMLGRFEYPQFDGGTLGITPIPALDNGLGTQLGALAMDCISAKRDLDRTNELSHVFYLPELLIELSKTTVQAGIQLADLSSAWRLRVTSTLEKLANLQQEIDQITIRLYDLEDNDRQSIEVDLDSHSIEISDVSGEIGKEDELPDEDESVLSPEAIDPVAVLASYALGSSLGRWDLRCATSEHPYPELADPFAPLPAYSPGMLQLGEEGRPVTTYPVRNSPFTTRPILVDDPGHQDDIVTAVREVLAIIFAGQADAIYQEIVDVLVGSGHDLRPWLRTSFFDEHIKRYSKSRRKAPIYWCLSTPSRRYAIWLYYHRLHRDTLYTVLNDYVAPKLEHETRQLAQLRAEGGENPNATQRKAIENRADFVAELQTFRDEVRQVAPLWQPDLNDGVLINFAPLWRLTPTPRRWQQECQQTWDALRRGDYDWAHLALHLWPARVIPQCQTDRSLAIAHNLDTVFWDEAATGKAQPRPVEPTTVQALIAERSSAAVAAALAALQEAPIAAAAKATKHAAPAKPKRNARPLQAQAFQQAGLALDEDER